MKQGDLVVPAANHKAIPARVVEIVNMGHGEGKERVETDLQGFHRFYAKDELVVVE